MARFILRSKRSSRRLLARRTRGGAVATGVAPVVTMAVTTMVVATMVMTGCATASTRSPAPHPAGAPSGGPIVRVDQPALEAIAEQYRTACQAPGAAVSVRTRDGADHDAIAGTLAPGIALTRDREFLAGSVTKLFVTTVAYQLVAAHRLSLDATVDEFLRGWPRGDRVTVAMLLGHRSGMGDFGNDLGAQLTQLVLADLSRTFSYAEVLDLVKAVPPVAAPGATYHYSNANTIVLGAIVQRITHQSLGASMQRRIIGPLGLHHTIYGPDRLAAANAILFHGLFDVSGTGTPVDIGDFPRAAALTVDPAGAGLFSNLPDLLTFTHALFGTNMLLHPREQADLVRSVSTLNASALLLGRRFRVSGHGGVAPGAQTIVAYDATGRTTVAVWCNRLDPGPSELLPSVLAAKSVFELADRPEPR